MKTTKVIGRIQPAGDGRLIRTPGGFSLELTARDLAKALAERADPPPAKTPPDA